MKKLAIFLTVLSVTLISVIVFLTLIILREKNSKTENGLDSVVNENKTSNLEENSQAKSLAAAEDKIANKNEPVVTEKIVYIEKTAPKQPDTLNSEIITANKSNAPLSTEQDVQITYSYINQGKFDSVYAGEYGSILLGLNISTRNDIYIPKTTTDSSGSEIGFTYTIEGGFVGERNSEVNCSLKSDGYCKIKGGSVDKNISVNVWIYPEKPGEYVANFKKFGYKNAPKGTMNFIDINKSGDPLYIDY